MPYALLFCLLLLSLIGCSSKSPIMQQHDVDSAPVNPPDISQVPPLTPKAETLSRYGNADSYVVLGKRYYVMSNPTGFKERGIASWYGQKFHGRRTSSGEPYDMYGISAAHKQLPIPCYVKVTNLKNGKTIVVRVNDRGPFHQNRIIDLSYTAASRLDVLQNGTAPVEIEFIDPNDSKNSLVATEINHYDRPLTLFLQVGAFGDKANALRLQEKLTSLIEEPVNVEMVNKDEAEIYRVRIGPVAKIDTLDKLTEKLKTINITNTHVIIY